MHFSIEERPIKTLASGDVLKLKTFRFRSDEPGPTVCLQASVHGAEVQGQAVLYCLMDYLRNNPFRGEFIITPIANPIGMNHKSGTFTTGRFNPINGDNWNRLYVNLIAEASASGLVDLESFVAQRMEASIDVIRVDYKLLLKKLINTFQKNPAYSVNEKKRLFLTLQEIASEADIVLDLHTGPVAARYLYVANFLRKKSADLLFPFHLMIPEEFAGAMDEAVFCPWVALSDEFAEQGQNIEPADLIETYTVELGSEERISFQEAQTDVLRILHLLGRRGSIESAAADDIRITLEERGELYDHGYYCALDDYRTIYSEAAGVCEYLVKPGDVLSPGTPMARILNLNLLKNPSSLSDTIHEIRADEDMIIINHCPSAVVASGIDLFQVMTNFSKTD